MKYYIFLFIFVVVESVSAYSSGAPVSACETMTPNHFGGVPPQTDVSPFNLDVTDDGGKAVVIISSSEDDSFQGFLVEARDENDQIVGSFSVSDPQARTMTCRGGTNNAATHVDLSEKKSVEVRWSPPSYMKVNITATVLRDAQTFWVGQRAAYEGTGSSIKANFIILTILFALQQLWTRAP